MFQLEPALKAVINGPAKRLLLQIGAKKGAAEAHACFPVKFISLRHFPQIKFRIIMSFRKPCHMPFRKLIAPFTLTASKPRLHTLMQTPLSANQSAPAFLVIL